MSHFASIKTQIKDKVALQSALKELKIEFEEGTTGPIEMKTQWSGNQKQLVDLVIRGRTIGCGADIGFKFKSGEMVADDWELQRSTIANFRQRLVGEYSVAVAVRAGYRVVGRSVAADGRMQIQLETAQQVQARR